MFSFFNHEQFRRYLVAFGSIFNHIEIRRTDADGAEVQRLVVPIEYAQKERWFTRLTQDPEFLQGVGQTLPRLSYEVEKVSYDAPRKLNNFDAMAFPSSSQGRLTRLWSGVPYNIDINLTLLAKTQQDALQVVEQVLPFFTPDYIFAMETIPSIPLVDQIPVILNSVSPADSWDGEFEKLRAITWTFSFTMKVNFYGPVKTGHRIEEVIIDLYKMPLAGLDAPIYMKNEDGSLMLLESGTGHLMNEATANAYLTTGRVARIDAVALPNQVPEPGPNVLADVTLTEFDGDVKRNLLLEDE